LVPPLAPALALLLGAEEPPTVPPVVCGTVLVPPPEPDEELPEQDRAIGSKSKKLPATRKLEDVCIILIKTLRETKGNREST
jgi:hypothetical protein